LPIGPKNWLPWQRPLSRRENGAKSAMYDQLPTIWWKFDENRSSRSWVLFDQILKKRN